MSNPIGEASKQLEALIQNAFAAAIAAGQLPEAPVPAFVVEIPADTSHGDFATNAAMVSARAFHSAPRPRTAPSSTQFLPLNARAENARL